MTSVTSSCKILGRLLINVNRKSVTFLKKDRSLCTKTNLHDLQLDYHSKEYGIPVPGGTLAGKLWESKSSKEGSSDEVPPIICLHGWLDNAGTFDLILPMMMTPSTKYFTLDFPGHGLTTYCPHWWYDGHMEWILSVRRVAKYFGWEKFSIFGHSLGGIVGFLYAAYFPEQVHRLVTLETMRPLSVHPFQVNPISSDIQMIRESINLVFKVEETLKNHTKTYTFDEILQKLYDGRQGTVSKEGCLALLKRGASQHNKELYKFSHNLRIHNMPGQVWKNSPEMSLRLANEVTSPLCFIKADPGNVYHTEEETKKFLSIFRKNLGEEFEYHEVPGSHHFHLNDPQLVAPIALKFFTK